MGYHFDWLPVWQHRDELATGLAMTIALSAAALFLALVLGVAIGTAGAAQARGARLAAAAYVEVARNLPLLIHLYVWYMALAFLRLPAFLCAVLGLGLYSAGYVAEVVRAGIDSIPGGQRQAGLAGGLTPFQTMRLIVYPQALRLVAPSLASLFSQLIKDSSLASVITVAELAYEASAIDSDTFRTFEVYITLALLYLVLVTGVSRLMMRLAGRRGAAPSGRLADA